MDIDPRKTVSFSGHRSFKMNATQGDLFAGGSCDERHLISCIEEELRRLCMSGYDTFLCGMAEGFDLAAAQAVMNLRAEFAGIRQIAVVPYRGQARSFPDETRQKYSSLIAESDETIIMSETYSSDCFHRRNDFLVEHSSVLVCYYNGSKGGTAYTVKQALRRGVRGINIF